MTETVALHKRNNYWQDFIPVLFIITFCIRFPLQQRVAWHQRPGGNTRPAVVHTRSHMSPNPVAGSAGCHGHPGWGVAASGVHQHGTAGCVDVVSTPFPGSCYQALVDHAEHAHKRSGFGTNCFCFLSLSLFLSPSRSLSVSFSFCFCFSFVTFRKIFGCLVWWGWSSSKNSTFHSSECMPCISSYLWWYSGEQIQIIFVFISTCGASFHWQSNTLVPKLVCILSNK